MSTQPASPPTWNRAGPAPRRRRHRGGDRPLRRAPSPTRRHRAADHRGAGRSQRLDAPFDVVGREHAVPVDPHEDRRPCASRAHGSSPRPGCAPGCRSRATPETRWRPSRRAVGRAAVGDEHLDDVRVGLVGDRLPAWRARWRSSLSVGIDDGHRRRVLIGPHRPTTLRAACGRRSAGRGAGSGGAGRRTRTAASRASRPRCPRSWYLTCAQPVRPGRTRWRSR